MQRIDVYYIYQFGQTVRNLRSLNVKLFGDSDSYVTKNNAVVTLNEAAVALNQFLFSSVFSLTLVQSAGQTLLSAITVLKESCQTCNDETEVLGYWEFSPVSNAISEFEAVLKAELGRAAVYLVKSKNAWDVLTLVDDGMEAFPEDLFHMVPDVQVDIEQAMKCLAFELPTAAAFHLHRANELVLRRYWHSVSSGQELKSKTTMGQIVNKLEGDNLGDKRVRALLRDVVDLHRNPTVHPETSLETVEDAVLLYGAIRSAIGFMLKEIN